MSKVEIVGMVFDSLPSGIIWLQLRAGRGEIVAKLNWKLLIKKRAGVTQGLPPGKEDLAWVTNTVTLVYGERDAVLVDTFLSRQHSKELVDWLAQSGKNLTTIYVTHAHGDHSFGLKLVLDRFPNARALATASTVASMQNQIKPELVRTFWEVRFPGQVPADLIVPEVLEGDTLYLEGEAAIPTRRTQLRRMYLPLVWLSQGMRSTTALIPTLRNVMKRRGTSGLPRWIKSSLCIRERW
jgi:hypothetical protein